MRYDVGCGGGWEACAYRRVGGAPLARILLIEDDPSIRQLLAEFLTDEGHDVRPAVSLQDVLAGPVTNGWQLVITDSPRPHWDPTLPAVHQLVERLPHTPVVLFTAHEAAGALDAGKLGLAAIWLKPMDLGEMSNRLAAVLREPARE
jgi:two-component system, OmpR family, response regulator